MTDLKAVDTIIAMVIVLLVLSLIVQSIQSLVKKFLKIKSRSIIGSLDDLFEYVDTQALGSKAPAELVEKIKGEFKKIGRVSLIFRRPVVESISKADLVKILEKVESQQVAQEAGKWFDTVMQGFEERYTRHMKTIAICISILVVILLNANFFQVYHNISNSDVMRNAVLQKRDLVQQQLKVQRSADLATANDAEALKAELTQLQTALDEAPGLGFKPLTPMQVYDFLAGKGVWDGVAFPNRFAHGLKVLGGFAIMVMLLSVGAPFWQDALESLFGLKNLLRKKSDTQNVEDEGGQRKDS
ncbi:MAG TPA: hypothetical protein VJ372_05215 [Pyrinomonadaceae bacterium]|jgi:hypothetical protein|nr:hypothetical protein [Pyrinomonadaceae bacterium]